MPPNPVRACPYPGLPPSPPNVRLEIKNIATPMSPQDNQCYFWCANVQCVFDCTCGGGGRCDWGVEEECMYVCMFVCTCPMCVLERGPTPRHLFFCRVLWCHPPTTPLCFHTRVSHTAPALFLGRCVCAHTVPNGRYFELEFCQCLFFFKHILKDFYVSSCPLERDAGIARIIAPCSFWQAARMLILQEHLLLYCMQSEREQYVQHILYIHLEQCTFFYMDECLHK